jgi:Fe-S cluster biosynthesis and repair protein YggX
MTRIVHCVKLGISHVGLDFLPFPGELGQQIYEHVSKEAWQQWLKHQTILINEYRLNTLETQAKEFLKKEMRKFLFNTEDTTQS